MTPNPKLPEWLAERIPAADDDQPTSTLPAWLAHNRAEVALRREAEEFNAAATRAMYARMRADQ